MTSAGKVMSLIKAIGATKKDVHDEIQTQLPGEVSDWLGDHITNPDSPPLDRSLSSSSAAAPADLVGGLKSAFEARTDNITYNMIDLTTVQENKAVYENKPLVNGQPQLVNSNNLVTTPAYKMKNGEKYAVLVPYSSAGNLYTWGASGGYGSKIAFSSAGSQVTVESIICWKYTFTSPYDGYFALTFQIASGNYGKVAMLTPNYEPEEFIAYGKKNIEKTNLNDSIKNIQDDMNEIFLRVGTNEAYTSLLSAINYIKEQKYSRATIAIMGGEYDYYVESNGSTDGYTFPNHCDVIGYNDPVVSMILDNDHSTDIGSTINHPLDNTFTGIVFTAQNCRYVLHDDQGQTWIVNNVRVPNRTLFNNCKFINLGGGRNIACGCGFGMNHTAIFNDCLMKSNSFAFTIHGEEVNNCNWELNNCEIIALWGYGNYDIRIASYGSGDAKSYLNLHNCKYRRVLIDFSDSYSVSGHENCVFCTDTDTTEYIVVNDNCDFSTYLSDKIKIFPGSYSYEVGDIVSISTNMRDLTAYSATSIFGVVVYTDSNETRIKTGGFIPARFVPSGLSSGYIGIQNGSFVNVQSKTDAVGLKYADGVLLY